MEVCTVDVSFGTIWEAIRRLAAGLG